MLTTVTVAYVISGVFLLLGVGMIIFLLKANKRDRVASTALPIMPPRTESTEPVASKTRVDSGPASPPMATTPSQPPVRRSSPLPTPAPAPLPRVHSPAPEQRRAPAPRPIQGESTTLPVRSAQPTVSTESVAPRRRPPSPAPAPTRRAAPSPTTQDPQQGAPTRTGGRRAF